MVGPGCGQLGQHLRRARGRQQVALPALQAGAEGDQEAVALLAQVEQLAPRRQARGDGVDLGQELARAHGLVGTPEHDAVGIGGVQQRQGHGRRGRARIADRRHRGGSPPRFRTGSA